MGPLVHAPVRLLPLVVLVMGAALRIIPWLTSYPLHRDEALYGAWARLIASGRDPWLLTPWVDKPPLAPYLMAGSLKLFGVSTLALRLPGMVASLLTLLVCYALARRAYAGLAAREGRQTAVLAAFLLAVSPFAILFSPTAFTDPWLTLWLLAAAWAALAGRPLAAGLALGLAVASKQQGVLAIPLVLALLFLRARPPDRQLRPVRALLASLLGFALVLAPLTCWDSLRWSNRSSFWERSATTYGGLALAPVAQWPQRAAEWGQQLGYLYGLPVLSALLLLLAACAGLGALWRLARVQPRQALRPAALPPPAQAGALAFGDARRPAEPGAGGLRDAGRREPACVTAPENAGRPCEPSTLALGGTGRQPEPGASARPVAVRPAGSTTADRVDAVLALYVAAYLALHFILSFQPWDRYLLPIVPLVAILAARGLLAAWRWRPVPAGAAGPASPVDAGRPRNACRGFQPPGTPPLPGSPAQIVTALHLARTISAAGLAALLAWSAWLGAGARLPVGSDHGAYFGLERIVADLLAQPAAAVVYHQWIGWHYDYYLFDAPQERRWWGTPWKLADDAAATAQNQPWRTQWLAVPGWEDQATGPLQIALASRGLALAERDRTQRPDGSLSFTLYQIVPAVRRGR